MIEAIPIIGRHHIRIAMAGLSPPYTESMQ